MWKTRTGPEAEKETLLAQLAAVGEELKAARVRIAALEAAHMGAKDEVALKYIRREALFLVPRLMELLPPGERFVIVDAGARDGEDDPRWRPFPPHRLAIFGFEPDQAEAARLNELARKNGHERRVHAAGLWRTSGCLHFHHNKASGGGSFLPQNREITDRWKFENPTATSPAREVFVATHTEPLRVTSLKEWASEAGLTEIDFVKLNVQGAELQVLEGAAGLLDGVLGILVEVSFVESYRGRPLFADIDAHLRGAGFTFFDLLAHHYVGRAVAPVAAQHLALVQPTLGQQVSAWGQLVEGHALYLRDPLTPDAGSPDVRRCLKLAALAEACGQIEFAFEVLGWLVRRADVASRDLASQLRQACVDGAEDYRRHLAVREPR
ncbi:MAG TPA: FkbM family methyltransferase [Hyphomicrobiaceae bacterium]|nr:FkbM family methyltransferase [Hyphomicrobiaceae bacterium]